jgi:hypothetical protein
MINSQTIPQTPALISAVPSTVSPVSQLREKYEKTSKLYQSQPESVKKLISLQADQLGQAIVHSLPVKEFSLPSQVVVQDETLDIPHTHRQQRFGGLFDRAVHKDNPDEIKQRLSKLEGTSNPALRISANLIRYATAVVIVHAILPAGQAVVYEALDGDEIPNVPVDHPAELPLAMPFEQRFFLPQWIALDNKGNLLVQTVSEAYAHLASMQSYLDNLQVAVCLAPYMVVDEIYQQKRYGMVGELVNQGRALACYETIQAINRIKQRAANNDLNRGLKLSLPYFDDQQLELKMLDFTIIPAGHFMFVPAFVVLAARREQSLVAQDTRLSLTTRKYLLAELSMLEKAFYSLSDFAL